MMDAGLVTLCTLQNIAESGDMPKNMLIPGVTLQFEERTNYRNRDYQAEGVTERFDMMIRIWRMPVKIGQYALLTEYEDQENEGGDQYQIEDIQKRTNEYGLKVTDLSLKRVDQLYEVFTE